MKTVTYRTGQVVAVFAVVAHVGVLGVAVVATFMIVAVFAYCWTISSEDRSGRAAEIVRSFRGVPEGPSLAKQPAQELYCCHPAEARDDRPRWKMLGNRR